MKLGDVCGGAGGGPCVRACVYVHACEAITVHPYPPLSTCMFCRGPPVACLVVAPLLPTCLCGHPSPSTSLAVACIDSLRAEEGGGSLHCFPQ